MCDYNSASKQALATLPVPLTRLRSYLGRSAYLPFLRALSDGRARHGRDLLDGRALPSASLERGHYMTPDNFQRALDRMAAQPARCQWCHQQLPRETVRQHALVHNPREEIRHHFHPRCWEARIIAVSVIFGHATVDQFAVRGPRADRCPAHPARSTWRETVTLLVKRIVVTRTVRRLPPSPPHRTRER